MGLWMSGNLVCFVRFLFCFGVTTCNAQGLLLALCSETSSGFIPGLQTSASPGYEKLHNWEDVGFKQGVGAVGEHSVLNAIEILAVEGEIP